MVKVVVFDVGNGNFEEGFPVTLSIHEEGKPIYFRERGKLPPAPDIPELYKNFQQIYRNLPLVQRIITVDSAQTTNFSNTQECKNAAHALEESLRIWYKRAEMLELRQWVQEEIVNTNEPARVIFQTDDEILKKLPLHQWELFQKYQRAWLALGANNAKPASPLRTPVRILTILGNTEGLNVDIDTELLNQLPGAKIEILRNTTRRKLCETLRNEDEPWDILYFAGHSSTQNGGNDGVIQISDIDSLSLGELRNAFKKAIQNGLKLAIFNSCDGLGLANRLAKLGIPQVIVMREPVSDEVAHEFLQEFLRLFSQGELFYTAVRHAQEKLEDIENDYPCASWLPIICQNPAENSLLWPQPLINIARFQKFKRKIRIFWRRRKWVALASVGLLLSALIALINIGKPPTLNIDRKSSPPQTQTAPITTSSSLYNHGTLGKFISHGDKSLFNDQNTLEKEQGISSFNNRNWDSAIKAFTKSLKQKRNDPETLIYLNNAIALKNGNPLQIAASVPISANPEISQEILRGVAHAQSERNCNGVDRIKKAINDNQDLDCTGIENRLLLVKVVNDDSDNDSDNNLINVAKEITADQDILAVIGHYGSSSTIKAVNNAYQDQLAVISPSAASTELDKLKYQVYRTVPSNNLTAKILYDYAAGILGQSEIRALVIYNEEDSYSKTLKEEFQNLLPKRAYTSELDLNRSNFDSSNFVNNQANVLLLIPAPKEKFVKQALKVVTQVSEIASDKPIFLSASTMYEHKIIESVGEAAQKSNLVLAVPWHRSTNSDSQNFEHDADKLWPSLNINWRTAMAYDAMKAVIEGVKNISSQDPIPRENLKIQFSRMLKGQNIATGASAPVKFTGKGSRSVSEHSQGIGVLVKVECKTSNQNSECDFKKLNE